MNIQRNLAILGLLVLMAATSACSFVVVGSGRTDGDPRRERL